MELKGPNGQVYKIEKGLERGGHLRSRVGNVSAGREADKVYWEAKLKYPVQLPGEPKGFLTREIKGPTRKGVVERAESINEGITAGRIQVIKDAPPPRSRRRGRRPIRTRGM